MPRRRRAIVELAALIFAAIACGSAPPPPAALPRYEPEEAALFNDLFRPELFGLPPADGAPETDGLLAERVAAADVVVSARIVTITREADGFTSSYSVVVTPLEAPLIGQIDATSITLFVHARSPAHGWIEAGPSRPIGEKMLLFLRNYEDGPHFYATVDQPSVREAIARVRIERKGPLDARSRP